MKAWIALSVAGSIVAATQSPSMAQTPPTGHAGEVVVKARKPIVVVADTCPSPDPVRHSSDRRPRVVDSFPSQGAVIAPGLVRVRVSFDQPMTCFSEVMVDAGEADPCQPDGIWVLPERRSWMMTCRLPPQTPVRIGFRRIDGQGFVGLSGRQAEPFTLDFATSDGPATATLVEAAGHDPGPPGVERRANALVTCVDARRAPSQGRDCRREATSSTSK